MKAHADYCRGVDLAETPKAEFEARLHRLTLDHKGYSTDEWDDDLAWLKANSTGLSYAEVLLAEQQAYYDRVGELSDDAVELLSEAMELGLDRPQTRFLRAVGHRPEVQLRPCLK